MHKILITGAHGFVGRHIVKEFANHGYEHRLLMPTHKQLNLLDMPSITNYFSSHKIRGVIHAAGQVGGLEYNKKYPADLMYTNLQMGINVIDAAKNTKVDRFILLSTTCGYPEKPKTIPFIEEELFDGMPESTNSGYGIAKRTLAKLLEVYYQQYKMESITLIPTNLVGPGDCFNDERSHVIAAVIKKFESARSNNKKQIKLFGDGSASRDFSDVRDCAGAVRLAFKDRSVKNTIVNIGSGKEIKIRELISTIQRLGDYSDIDPIFTGEVGNGQPRRCLDIQKAKIILNWQPSIVLEQSILDTIAWYRENHNA